MTSPSDVYKKRPYSYLFIYGKYEIDNTLNYISINNVWFIFCALHSEQKKKIHSGRYEIIYICKIFFWRYIPRHSENYALARGINEESIERKNKKKYSTNATYAMKENIISLKIILNTWPVTFP